MTSSPIWHPPTGSSRWLHNVQTADAFPAGPGISLDLIVIALGKLLDSAGGDTSLACGCFGKSTLSRIIFVLEPLRIGWVFCILYASRNSCSLLAYLWERFGNTMCDITPKLRCGCTGRPLLANSHLPSSCPAPSTVEEAGHHIRQRAALPGFRTDI